MPVTSRFGTGANFASRGEVWKTSIACQPKSPAYPLLVWTTSFSRYPGVRRLRRAKLLQMGSIRLYRQTNPPPKRAPAISSFDPSSTLTTTSSRRPCARVRS